MEHDEFEFIRMNNNLVCVDGSSRGSSRYRAHGKDGHTGTVTLIYVTFCHFGYEVFSEKTNKHAKENKTAVYVFD